MLFLNTDIFLSFLTESDTPRAAAARAVFSAVESGNRKVTTSSLVLVTLINVLHSPQGYNQPKERVAYVLSLLLGLRNLRLPDKKLWLEVLTIWVKRPVEIVDAYNLAYARRRGISYTPSYSEE